uniref:Uncharacterized protein n=1 Tax=Brassica campestris TaxID=3711 RepID=A0A3P6B6R4_BRACM|nr:unnamed protein product [Brassica rapa]
MHHLCPRSRRHPLFQDDSRHVKPCFILANVLPGGILNALATALHRSSRFSPSIHRFLLGLLGYLIPFGSPSFHLSVSVSAQQNPIAVGILSDLYAFHRSTGNSLCPYRTQA